MARVVRGTSSFQISTDRNHSGEYYIRFSLKLFFSLIIPVFETCSKSYYNCGSSIFIISLVALDSTMILCIDLSISICFIYHSMTIVLYYSTFHFTYYWVHTPKIITDIDKFISLFSSLLSILFYISQRELLIRHQKDAAEEVKEVVIMLTIYLYLYLTLKILIQTRRWTTWQKVPLFRVPRILGSYRVFRYVLIFLQLLCL